MLSQAVRFSCAVVVARPGDQQVEGGGQVAQLSALLLVVVAVVHLQAGQPGRGQSLDHRVGDHPAACSCPRVRQHRHPAGGPHQAHHLDRRGRAVGHVVGPAGVEDLGEGGRAGAHVPALHESIGDVRPAHRAARLDPVGHLGPAELVVGGHELDHPARPAHPRLTCPGHGRGQRRGLGVVQVGEQVHADAAGRGRQLRTPHQRHPGVDDGVRGRPPTVPGVVVGEGHDVEPGVPCRGHELGGVLGTVGQVRVRMEIDSEAGGHDAQRTVWRDRVDPTEACGPCDDAHMTDPDRTADQPLSERGSNRSQRPSSPAFRAFIASSWAERGDTLPPESPAAPYAAARRERLSALFPGERLVIPAGTLVTRSNDTDYRFRPHSAFAHLTGLGTDQEPDSVLVLHPQVGTDGEPAGHEPVLYFRPRAGKDTEEFYADSRYGELWVGERPSLAEISAQTGLRAEHIEAFADEIAKDAGAGGVQVRVVTGADAAVEAQVETARAGQEQAAEADAALVEALSELRLTKDEYEVEQMREAVAATVKGFEDIVRSLPRAVAHPRGERVIEGVFGARAREEGNAVGYDTIAAAGNHANTLHWIRNDGQVRPGELVLVDAGVEMDSLYTADITRTLPVDGTFTDIQRTIYTAVLDAADAAFAAARPGLKFRDVHAAAMDVLAARLEIGRAHV